MARSSRQATFPGMQLQQPPSPQPAATASADRQPTSHETNIPTSLSGQTVWVVDANSLIFQVFHAIPEMSSPRGEPVNALYGFTRDMFYLLEAKQPSYLFCAFDMAGPTFRHELYAGYKARRAEFPDELVPQFPAVRRILEALSIPILELEGFEADDILATLARRTAELGGQCFLVSGDKDCRQLLGERVGIYNIRKDLIYDEAALAAEWGIRPQQVVDFQALVGDPVDDIPGVPLIGPKIARELLAAYGTLEGVLEHAGEVPGQKRKENLLAAGAQCMLSRRLCRLDDHVPVMLDWEAGHVTGYDHAQVLALLDEYGFRSFAAKLRTQQVAHHAPTWTADYRLVDTPEKLRELVDLLSRQSLISVDTETTSIMPREAQLVGYSFAWDEGTAYYVAVRGPEGAACCDPVAARDALRGVLENPHVKKVGQNLKYDMIVLRGAGIELAGLAFDTMVASYLLDSGARSHGLDELSRRHLQHETIKITELIGDGPTQRRMDEVPLEQVARYAGEDADVALRLQPILGRRLAESGLLDLFSNVEVPLVDVLCEMEFNGIRVDVARLKSLSEQYAARLAALEAEIYALAGRSFNIASPKQLQVVLFDELRLKPTKRNKSGPSTDADVLEELARIHPLPAKIVEFRQFAKLKNTYVDALPAMVNSRTGRVHASFNQTVAATGRLSSSDPNLQNIPIRTREGREIRSAFLPGHDGWRLLAADYSQIELRVLAHFSDDPTLCETFARDEDIHSLVASQVQRVPIDQVTPEMRYRAKAVNFGVIYGQSPFGLSKQLNIEQEQAAAFIDAYFVRYARVEEFLERVLADCRAKGYVSTILGRRRAIAGVREDAAPGRNLAERTAINTVIQGSAADLIKLAMIAIHGRLRREKRRAKMLLQIHDELVFEVPLDEVDRLAPLVVEEMAGVMQLRVPLKVDVQTGANWADMEPWG